MSDIKFDLNVVKENFEIAQVDNDDVLLELYLKSFEELNKFFLMLGSIFTFVSDELTGKVNILNEFLKNTDNAHHFKTVKSMILYEKNNQLLKKSDYVSGSRTLLRLHRGLDFIRNFLEKLSKIKNEEGASAACKSAYEETLANYHGFFIRCGAYLAMCTLPTKQNILENVCGDEENIQRTLEILPVALEMCSNIYDRIDQLYTQFNLHSLP